jgi:hypothetical protein
MWISIAMAALPVFAPLHAPSFGAPRLSFELSLHAA